MNMSRVAQAATQRPRSGPTLVPRFVPESPHSSEQQTQVLGKENIPNYGGNVTSWNCLGDSSRLGVKVRG
jgi:hypothetical protein